jgi:hypothetical protein
VSPDKPIGEPAIVVALDDQVVIEQLIFDVGTKKRTKNSINFPSNVISKNSSQSDCSLESLIEMKRTLDK